MQISVIIPVLNEEAVIGACLAQFCGVEDVELIVVDGGSTDDTQEVVEALGRAQWVQVGKAGRALQMNAGVERATGDVFLFLHADTFLPSDGLMLIRDSLRVSSVVGGRFRLELSEKTIGFRLVAFFSTLRSRYLGITYGDQGIYIRRETFNAVGGFPPLQLFEDSEFCARVALMGKFVMLNARVCSSTRRWRKWGFVRTVVEMWVLRILYACSVSDVTLSRWYR
ncbi:MAG: glycosyltransferase [Gemmatimonadetes bacterium]|nr:glycosyltransferase [Gemmatimonadota bacterium]MYF72108.1 glycosyltransferase [Gemmatimonadota bacterium]MYK50185.1 glycosyltransferase [Gemmatimonadota bacterium]